MKNNCDCIIPFYNEGSRVIAVVESVLKVESLTRIIVVDDCSDDRGTYLELKHRFPQIILVRLEKNSGKPNAIKVGLEYVSAEYVLLLDGDLLNINDRELGNAIQKITNDPEIDMIILRRVADKTAPSWTRQDIVTSGQRILKKDDLKNVFQKYPPGYPIEWALNIYMLKNHKKYIGCLFHFKICGDIKNMDFALVAKHI